tara:strand:- start:5997 stop:6179 length:183 start_codon:yes stop_codon:yes gene_type:complete
MRVYKEKQLKSGPLPLSFYRFLKGFLAMVFRVMRFPRSSKEILEKKKSMIYFLGPPKKTK